MPIDQDFEPSIAAQVTAELTRFADKCRYDEAKKKIIYKDDRSAMEVYLLLQREEMEKHKWIESEKACCDLGCKSLSDWVNRHSKKFAAYWRKTHVYVQAKNLSTAPAQLQNAAS